MYGVGRQTDSGGFVVRYFRDHQDWVTEFEWHLMGYHYDKIPKDGSHVLISTETEVLLVNYYTEHSCFKTSADGRVVDESEIRAFFPVKEPAWIKNPIKWVKRNATIRRER